MREPDASTGYCSFWLPHGAKHPGGRSNLDAHSRTDRMAGRQVRMLLSFQRPSRLAWAGTPPGSDAPGCPQGRSERAVECSAHGWAGGRAGRRGPAGREAAQATRRAATLLSPAGAGAGSGACRAAGPGRRGPPREVERVGPQRLAVEPHAALGEHAPRLRARPAEELRDAAPAGGRSPLAGRSSASSTSSGSSCATWMRSNAASAASAAASPWKRATRRAGERALGVARRRAGGRLLAEQQVVPRRERLVGDAQRLAVHLLGRLGDADVVAERLRHLLLAVGARAGSAS